MDNVDIYCGHLEYFTALGYILWALWKICSHLVCFPALVYCTKKNLATQLVSEDSGFQKS
jgi:hypothetical protein